MTAAPPDPALALAAFFAVVALGLALFWPRRGMVPRLLRRRRLSNRVRLEDALKHLFHATADGRPADPDRLAGSMEVSRGQSLALIGRLQEEGLAAPEGAGTVLTDEGRVHALRILRRHRLVERFLADRTGVGAEDWHDVAEVREHQLSSEEAERLAARMGQPRFDPHGDPIPTASGELPERRDRLLSDCGPGEAGTVTHLEDEPKEAFERLLSLGFALGKPLVVRGVGDASLQVEMEGRVLSVPRVLAPAVSLHPHAERSTAAPRTLADLHAGESGRVARIAPTCAGAQRRRLLDLGVVPGTEVRAEFASASGDPIAYRVRGALIALRHSQARSVEIEGAAGNAA
jgi:DtxR family Mn-dependent transcriptional regulator